MTDKQIVNTLIIEKGITKRQMAEDLGLIPQNINSRLKEGTCMQTNKLIEMLDYLGYDLAIVPKKSKLPSAAYIVGKE